MNVSKKFFSVMAVCILVSFACLPVWAEQPQQTAESPALEGKININTAEAEQLTMLPGIGEKTAGLIVEYRTKNGNFKTIDDLTNVKGIGTKTLEKIRMYLILTGKTARAKK